mmetsp:Transcript_15120/g.42874  ORF Transcript_15120/g.42874 Transcript_15120/m.42874 type:complete len:219 (-) Transcript_15120:9-665(-)
MYVAATSARLPHSFSRRNASAASLAPSGQMARSSWSLGLRHAGASGRAPAAPEGARASTDAWLAFSSRCLPSCTAQYPFASVSVDGVEHTGPVSREFPCSPAATGAGSLCESSSPLLFRAVSYHACTSGPGLLSPSLSDGQKPARTSRKSSSGRGSPSPRAAASRNCATASSASTSRAAAPPAHALAHSCSRKASIAWRPVSAVSPLRLTAAAAAAAA